MRDQTGELLKDKAVRMARRVQGGGRDRINGSEELFSERRDTTFIYIMYI
jgi:hypothetical protein